MILQSENLMKRYGAVVAVAGLSLHVPRGSIYGFLGRNGAGKTTTIRMLMGIIKPEAGTIRIFDRERQRIGREEKQRIGYVSQEQFFYPWMTCRYIGRFVSGFYPTWEAQEYDRLLHTLDLPPDRKISALSGGMRLKLALALALAHRPELLILDEPTAGLDPLSRREFLDMIKQQAEQEQHTTFFSSHIIDEVERLADHIGIIEKGKLCFEGELSALRQSVKRVRIPAPAALLPEPNEQPAEAAPAPDYNRLFAENGLRILQTRADANGREWMLYAEPAAWPALDLPEAQIEAPTLEDIFIAFTKT